VIAEHTFVMNPDEAGPNVGAAPLLGRAAAGAVEDPAAGAGGAELLVAEVSGAAAFGAVAFGAVAFGADPLAAVSA